jgi:MFS family permease
MGIERRPSHSSLQADYMLLVFAFFFSFFYRVSASVVLPGLGAEWGLSASSIGFVSGLYFWVYSLSQPFAGLLNDRFGPTLVAAVGLAVAAIGAVSFATASSVIGLAAGRLLTGVGLASILSGTVAFQKAAFQPDRYAFFSGIVYFIGNLGAVASVAPLGAALDLWGRRGVFLVLTALTVVLGLALLARRRRDPVVAGLGIAGASQRSTGGAVAPGLTAQLVVAVRTIVGTPQLAAMAVLWLVSYGALMTLQGLWGVEWCQTAYNATASTSRIWATMVSVGVMAGNVIGSRTAPSAGRRGFAITVASIAGAGAWALLWSSMSLRAPIWFTGGACALVGAASGACYVHLTAGVNDLSRKGQGGAVFGTINMMPSLGVIIGQWGAGAVIDRGSGLVGAAGRAYTPAAFTTAFGVIVAIILASQFLLVRIKGFEEGRPDGAGAQPGR